MSGEPPRSGLGKPSPQDVKSWKSNAVPTRQVGKSVGWERRRVVCARRRSPPLPELLERVIRGLPTGRRRSILRDVGLDGQVEIVKLNFGEN